MFGFFIFFILEVACDSDGGCFGFFLRWVVATTVVLVVVLVCGFLVVRFGFDGFCLSWPPWVLGLWVLFAALSSASLSSSHGEASLSQV